LKRGSLGKLYSTGVVNFRSIFHLSVTGGHSIRLSLSTFVFSSTIRDWWLAGPFTNSHRNRATQPCTIRLCTQHLAHFCTHTAVSQTDCPNGENVNRRSCQVTCRVVTARVLFASSVALRLEQRREKSTTLRLFHLLIRRGGEGGGGGGGSSLRVRGSFPPPGVGGGRSPFVSEGLHDSEYTSVTTDSCS